MKEKKEVKEVKEENFKPQVLSINQIAIDKAIELANDKLITFNAIVDYVEEHTDISKVNLKALNEDVMQEFKRAYLEENKAIANVPLSFEKTAYLLNLDTKQLEEMAFIYYENSSNITIEDGKAVAEKVDVSRYKRMTRSQEENDKLAAVKMLVKALDEVGKFTHVYKGNIQKSLGSFVVHHRGSDSLNLNLALLPRVNII